MILWVTFNSLLFLYIFLYSILFLLTLKIDILNVPNVNSIINIFQK